MLITDPEIVKVWLAQQKIIAIDTETNITELDSERYLVGISFYSPGGEPFYYPVGHVEYLFPIENGPVFDFTEYLRPDVTLVLHNAKFDIKVLRTAGIDLCPFDIIDTMLWHHLVDQYRPHDLASLEKSWLNKDTKGDIVKALKGMVKDKGMEAVPPIAMAKYAENDVVSTYELYALLRPKMEALGLIDIWETDQKFMKLLVQIEERGLKLDRPRALLLAKQSEDRIESIRQLLPFDPAKPSQVIARFFGDPPTGLGLRPSKLTPTGKPSTDDDAMTAINHPEAGLLLEYRTLSKAVSTWFRGLCNKADTRGYVHPSFKQHGTLTHRLSGENPNPQQFPRKGPVRGLFLPEEGCELIEFDYRAIEFRLAAWYSGNASLIEVFQRDGDIHQAVADQLGIGRQPAKNTNFTIIYEGGPSRIATTAGIPLRDARTIYNSYRSEYPEIFAISERCKGLAESRGYIKYWDGRRRIFKHTFECRKAFNSIIQGGAFQIIKHSMLILQEMDIDVCNQVHDSIWVSLPIGSSKEPIERAMVDWTIERFNMPFTVEHKVLNSGQKEAVTQ